MKRIGYLEEAIRDKRELFILMDSSILLGTSTPKVIESKNRRFDKKFHIYPGKPSRFFRSYTYIFLHTDITIILA